MSRLMIRHRWENIPYFNATGKGKWKPISDFVDHLNVASRISQTSGGLLWIERRWFHNE